MLVLIAHSLTQHDAVSGDSLDQGLKLVKLMSGGGNQASAESKVIVTLQQAISRLRRQNDASMGGANDGSSNQPQLPLSEQWETLWHPSLALASDDYHPSQYYDSQQGMSGSVGEWPSHVLSQGTTTMPYLDQASGPGALIPEGEQGEGGGAGIDFWNWDGPCDFPFELNEFNLFPDLFTS